MRLEQMGTFASAGAWDSLDVLPAQPIDCWSTIQGDLTVELLHAVGIEMFGERDNRRLAHAAHGRRADGDRERRQERKVQVPQ